MPSWQGQACQATGRAGTRHAGDTPPTNTHTGGLPQDLLGVKTSENTAISATIMKQTALTNPLKREQTHYYDSFKLLKKIFNPLMR